MSMILVIAFTSAITTEEYVIADNLSKPECIRMIKEERKTMMSMEVEEAYLSYMNSFKENGRNRSTEHMDGTVVDWEINCVKEGK